MHPTIASRALRRLSLLLVPALAAIGGSASVATWVYISNADSQDISVLELDRAQGTLKPVESVNVGGTVMPMAVSPDKRFLYAALRSQPFRVASFAIDGASGKLRKLGEAPLADSMANIDTDATGRWLFAASYPGHKITVNSIDPKTGSVGPIQQLLATAPNAHAIRTAALATRAPPIPTAPATSIIVIGRSENAKAVSKAYRNLRLIVQPLLPLARRVRGNVMSSRRNPTQNNSPTRALLASGIPTSTSRTRRVHAKESAPPWGISG